MLKVENITKSFGGHRVLDKVSFDIAAGEAMALFGANGAGKTTLLRVITLLLPPDSGQVLFGGCPMTPSDLSRIGYLPEERGLYRHAAAGEQAVYLARLKGMSRADAVASAHAWFDRLGMAEWWHRPVRSLSKGMQQRLQLLVTVVHSPALLILDEPFSGFDEAGCAMLCRELAALKTSGTAILLSTHNRQAAAKLCDKTMCLDSPTP